MTNDTEKPLAIGERAWLDVTIKHINYDWPTGEPHAIVTIGGLTGWWAPLDKLHRVQPPLRPGDDGYTAEEGEYPDGLARENGTWIETESPPPDYKGKPFVKGDRVFVLMPDVNHTPPGTLIQAWDASRWLWEVQLDGEKYNRIVPAARLQHQPPQAEPQDKSQGVHVRDFIYEDELPPDIPEALYDAWYAASWVDGVRMGPPLWRLLQPNAQPPQADPRPSKEPPRNE